MVFYCFQGSLEDELHDEPGQGLDEEEEEVYDALNDETFGTDAVGRLQYVFTPLFLLSHSGEKVCILQIVVF